MIWLGETRITRQDIVEAKSMGELLVERKVPITDEYVVEWELIDDGFRIRWTEDSDMIKEAKF
jgi:hypothetical protein